MKTRKMTKKEINKLLKQYYIDWWEGGGWDGVKGSSYPLCTWIIYSLGRSSLADSFKDYLVSEQILRDGSESILTTYASVKGYSNTLEVDIATSIRLLVLEDFLAKHGVLNEN